MTGSPGERGSRPLLGVAMMLLAVLSFTILDSTAKYLSSSLPVAQLVWGRFFFTLLLTLAFLPWLGLRGLCRTRRPLQQVLRGATLLGAPERGEQQSERPVLLHRPEHVGQIDDRLVFGA